MKKQLVVLSAAAIVAAAAVPALAFENEFHGMYRLRANMTNFQAAGLSGIQGTGTPRIAASTALLAEDDRTFTVFEQRARLQYIAKASDELKLVTFFEIDSSWGDSAYKSGARGEGAGAGGDNINLETKNVYLDFKIPETPVQVKLGLQPWGDAYKGIIYNNDIAGAVAIAKLDAVTATGAFFRPYDAGGNTTLGKKNVDVYVLDGKFALNKDTTLGASYYVFYNDNTGAASTTRGTGNAMTNTFGLNGAAKLGTVDLDAFVMYQAGSAQTDFQSGANLGETKDLSAWAAQIAAKANLGMATVRGALLYTSGDDKKDNDESNAFQVINENANGASPATFSSPGGNYYSGQMLLLFRNAVNMDSDQSIVRDMNNTNHGVMAGFLGGDFKVNDKFNASANVGFAYNAEKQQLTATTKEKEDYLGTELNLSLNYKLYPSLTATVQGAYLLLGDFFENRVVTASGAEDPKDPWLAGLMMNYTF